MESQTEARLDGLWAIKCLLLVNRTALVVSIITYLTIAVGSLNINLHAGDFVLVTLGATLLILLQRPWRLRLLTLADSLNARYPALEYSSHLVFEAVATKSTTLHQIQVNRATLELLKILKSTVLLRNNAVLKPFLQATLIGVSTAAFTYLTSSARLPRLTSSPLGSSLKHLAPVFSMAYSITVISPKYSGIEPKHLIGKDLKDLAIKALSGSALKVALIPSDSSRPDVFLYGNKLSPNKRNELFQGIVYRGKVSQNGVLKIKGLRYEIDVLVEMIKDAPPTVVLQPSSLPAIRFGESLKIKFNIKMKDDFRLTDGNLVINVAKGSGEGVKFKESRYQLNQFLIAHPRSIGISQMINFEQLGLTPGDEAYVHAEGSDATGQVTRSETCKVLYLDTAAQSSGLAKPSLVSLVPEYFRSERQLIMDTEKLLHQAGLPQVQFNERSFALGADQKLLRLRYSKFLGGEDFQEQNLTSDLLSFGKESVIIDQYTDKHDNAEDATFLDKSAKSELGLLMNDMWSAELQLRTGKPARALPFEYRALKRFKEMQERSRVYVSAAVVAPKITVDVVRLSGKADVHHFITKTNLVRDSSDNLAKTIRLLDSIKNLPATHERITVPSFVTATQSHLMTLAAGEPRYLTTWKKLSQVFSRTRTRWNSRETESLMSDLSNLLQKRSTANLRAGSLQIDVQESEKRLMQTYFNLLNGNSFNRSLLNGSSQRATITRR